MALVNTAKAIEIAHELANRIVERIGTTLALVESFDTDGCPVITIGSGTAGQANIVIKGCQYSWPLATDALGLTAGAYGPEVLMLATEAPAAGAGAGQFLSLPNLLPILGEALRFGARVEWYQSANGVAPTVSTFSTASNLKAAFWPSAKWSLSSAQ